MSELNTHTSIVRASAFALVAWLALTPAQAADLGGDCCADLEERVAELEATTARKGNRKVSLTIAGNISYVMLYWDDDGENDVYIGDNSEDETAFEFEGEAEFAPGWSAGFLLEIVTAAATSEDFDQKSDGAPEENADGEVELEYGAWYIKSERLGEVWMGRYLPATRDITEEMNIAETPNADVTFDTGRAFFLRAPAGTGGCQGSGCLYNIRLGDIAPDGNTRIGEVIRYNSPSLAGLVFSVSWGEDDLTDVAVRYEKEWNSVKVLAGIGYLWDTDENEDDVMLTCDNAGGNLHNSSLNNPGIPTGIANPQVMQASSLNGVCRDYRFDLERLAGAFGAMHKPSGLYAYFGGHRDTYSDFSTFDDTGQIPATNIQGLRTGGGDTEADDGTHWYLQLGIKRRMLLRNLGATTLYGEYQEWDDWRVGNSGVDNAGRFTGESPFGFNNQNAATLCPLAETTGTVGTAAQSNVCANGTTIIDSEVDSWGFGIVQDIDKAAMKLWLSYRKFDPEVRTQTVLNAGNNDNLPTTVLNVDHRVEDIWMMQFGGKLEF